ncbi:MAG: hypothetical protein V4478_02375 [Patescibacteria group bacterium]
MLTIIVADTKPYRAERIAAVLADYADSEVIMLDDTLISIDALEHYVYPSLFTLNTPVVHGRFILEAKEKELSAALIKKLIASPTVFLLEELSLSKPFITSIKKQGAIVHVQEPAKKAEKESLFNQVSFVTIASKKDRWLAYQAVLAKYPIEAVLGLLYWKVRDVALKERDPDGQYHVLYAALLEAHAAAWQQGTPLSLAIEKVLLTH